MGSIGIVAASISTAGGSRPSGADPLQRVGTKLQGDVSVLTYNVHALPWPLACGRDAAISAIEDRLIAMRRGGEQPHIVVLQEVFSDRARNLGANAGYLHIIDGPTTDHQGGMLPTRAVKQLAEANRTIKGETAGKWLPSGLQILSDYPVLEVRRAVFPTGACAGYDCLANKGALLVTVKIPGQREPVAVVTAHLNSKKASGVSETRSFAVYREQARLLGAFVRKHRNLRSPLILAGDLNANNGARRAALLHQLSISLAANPDQPGSSSLARIIGQDWKWPEGLNEEAEFIDERGRDWQFFAAGEGHMVRPVALRIPFGREPGGAMLSDHMGMEISYRF